MSIIRITNEKSILNNNNNNKLIIRIQTTKVQP